MLPSGFETSFFFSGESHCFFIFFFFFAWRSRGQWDGPAGTAGGGSRPAGGGAGLLSAGLVEKSPRFRPCLVKPLPAGAVGLDKLRVGLLVCRSLVSSYLGLEYGGSAQPAPPAGGTELAVAAGIVLGAGTCCLALPAVLRLGPRHTRLGMGLKTWPFGGGVQR